MGSFSWFSVEYNSCYVSLLPFFSHTRLKQVIQYRTEYEKDTEWNHETYEAI